jgi:hypothetical protein
VRGAVPADHQCCPVRTKEQRGRPAAFQKVCHPPQDDPLHALESPIDLHTGPSRGRGSSLAGVPTCAVECRFVRVIGVLDPSWTRGCVALVLAAAPWSATAPAFRFQRARPPPEDRPADGHPLDRDMDEGPPDGVRISRPRFPADHTLCRDPRSGSSPRMTTDMRHERISSMKRLTGSCECVASRASTSPSPAGIGQYKHLAWNC